MTHVDRDTWLMLFMEGPRHYRKQIGDLLSCPLQEKSPAWKATIQPTGNLSPIAGKAIASEVTGGGAALPQN